MEYINRMKEENLDLASEFLEMAARLVQIKSLSLLPKHEEADTMEQELAGELIEYQECKKVAEILSKMADYNVFVREPLELELDMTYNKIHEADVLLKAYLESFGKNAKRLPPPKEAFYGIVKKKVVSVSSRVVYVLRRMWKSKIVTYKSLFDDGSEKSELVATFLAVLELVRGKRVRIHDDNQDIKLELIDRSNEL
jgi:segregation and condensation protein A